MLKKVGLLSFFVLQISAALAQQEVLLAHPGYTVLYSESFHAPLYVHWTLTKKDLNCPVKSKRKGMNFHADPFYKQGGDFGKDYKKSGYDKGHICPAADRACADSALFDTFCYTNCTMQRPELNRIKWEHLESAVRKWVLAGHDSLLIYSGPVFPKEPEVMGAGRVAIPIAFYKIIYEPKVQKCVSYIMKNEKCSLPLNKYAYSLDEVQKISGRIFPELERIKFKCDTSYFN
jgi:endonuclease G